MSETVVGKEREGRKEEGEEEGEEGCRNRGEIKEILSEYV
jgi:hypothetical protein